MKRWIAIYVLFSLAELCGTALAQPKENISSVAHSAIDGSMVMAGHLGSKLEGCSSAHHGFVQKVTAEGRGLWRRKAPELLPQLLSLEATHVLASTFHHAVVDPLTGESFVLGEVFLGWHDAATHAAVSDQGLLVLKFDLEGNLVADAYLGNPPAGSALKHKATIATCPKGTWAHHVGGSVMIESDGGVVVTGYLPGPSGQDGQFFVTRLTANLGPDQDIPTAPEKFAVCSFNLELLRVTPLSNTQVSGDLTDLASDDGLTMGVGEMPGDLANSAGPGHGLEAEFRKCSVSQPDKLRFNLELDNDGDRLGIDIYLKSGDDMVGIGAFFTDENGRLDTTIWVANPDDYISGDRIIMWLKFVDVSGNCNTTNIDHCDGWEEE